MTEGQPPESVSYASVPIEENKDARMWAMFCHLGGLLPFTLGHIIAPLVIWIIKKDEYQYVNQQGKEALNFQITVTIGFLICIPLLYVFCLGAILAAIIGIADLVFIILATVSANNGEPYRYPVSIRFVS